MHEHQAKKPVSLTKCAQALGVSQPYLSKLKAQGRIKPDAQGSWEPDAVRREIQRTEDPGRILATMVRQPLRQG